MKQQQFVATSLSIVTMIPLLVTTFGGIMMYDSDFFKFINRGGAQYYIFTFFASAIFFLFSNFRTKIDVIFSCLFAVIVTFALKTTAAYQAVSIFRILPASLLMFIGMGLLLKWAYSTPAISYFRTLLFALGATIWYSLSLGVAGLFLGVRPDFDVLYGYWYNSLILFVLVGVGISFADSINRRAAGLFHVKENLLRAQREESFEEEEEEGDK